MKNKIMRALSIEIGPESYPRWPVPVVRLPAVSVWVAESDATARHTGPWQTPLAGCSHGVLIAAGALCCRSLPLVCHYKQAAAAAKM